MNKNVPKTHKVRNGIAAVIMNVILIIFSLSCIFPAHRESAYCSAAFRMRSIWDMAA